MQEYAERIRTAFMPLFSRYWPAREREHWERLHIHTAVCFTHPSGIDSPSAIALERTTLPDCAPWEKFRILTPIDIPTWAVSLSFEATRGPERGYTPYTLSPEQIQALLADGLKAVEWTDIDGLMPTGAPYGYLTLMDDDAPMMVMSLDRDIYTLGRLPVTGMLALPGRFTRVSRIHARITRTPEGVYLEDVSSTHGTYVEGIRIRGRYLLSDGRRFMLGGSHPSDLTCQLRYTVAPDTEFDVPSTALSR